MFYQIYTARKPPNVPVTVHSRHPVTPGGHGMAFAAYGARLNNALSMHGTTQQFFRVLTLVILTFDLWR